MVDLESATMQLYEDESLTGDVQDTEAQLLLKWGEARLASLVEQYADDEEGFDAAFKNMRRFIKSVARFIGNRQYAATDEQAEMLSQLTATAQTLNPAFQLEGLDTGAPDADVIQAVLSRAESNAVTAQSASPDLPVLPTSPETPELPTLPETPALPAPPETPQLPAATDTSSSDESEIDY